MELNEHTFLLMLRANSQGCVRYLESIHGDIIFQACACPTPCDLFTSLRDYYHNTELVKALVDRRARTKRYSVAMDVLKHTISTELISYIVELHNISGWFDQADEASMLHILLSSTNPAFSTLSRSLAVSEAHERLIRWTLSVLERHWVPIQYDCLKCAEEEGHEKDALLQASRCTLMYPVVLEYYQSRGWLNYDNVLETFQIFVLDLQSVYPHYPHWARVLPIIFRHINIEDAPAGFMCELVRTCGPDGWCMVQPYVEAYIEAAHVSGLSVVPCVSTGDFLAHLCCYLGSYDSIVYVLTKGLFTTDDFHERVSISDLALNTTAYNLLIQFGSPATLTLIPPGENASGCYCSDGYGTKFPFMSVSTETLLRRRYGLRLKDITPRTVYPDAPPLNKVSLDEGSVDDLPDLTKLSICC